ncbi:cyclin-A2-2-like isoform X2 [Corylus avellana]|uniref:cyclin-A2-2-like isoform X2 n=1 Tax=Corylus avellana TaxID=13451 RepID=UPI00286CF5EF|nr:cyclin-A2-2-like isoform X2 [Corylus avellana]
MIATLKAEDQSQLQLVEREEIDDVERPVRSDRQMPSTNYMEKLQRDITPSMRGILIDWLVEVSEEYKLVPDTLYLTVNLIDRFLSKNYMEKTRLQLLGVTCMLIASAYEAMLCYTLLLESEAEENMGHFSGPLACMGHSSHSFSMFRLDLLPHSRCCLAWRQSQFH